MGDKINLYFATSSSISCNQSVSLEPTPITPILEIYELRIQSLQASKLVTNHLTRLGLKKMLNDFSLVVSQIVLIVIFNIVNTYFD